MSAKLKWPKNHHNVYMMQNFPIDNQTVSSVLAHNNPSYRCMLLFGYSLQAEMSERSPQHYTNFNIELGMTLCNTWK